MKYVSILFILLATGIVTAQTQFEAKPNSEELKEDIFIITELTKSNFSISDSIVVKYKLYVSQSVGVESWQEADKPLYKGCDTNYIKSDKIKLINEEYNGKKYRTVVIREVILKPTQVGDLVLPEYTLNTEVSIPSETEKDVFDRFTLEKKKVIIKTDKISLTVKK